VVLELRPRNTGHQKWETYRLSGQQVGWGGIGNSHGRQFSNARVDKAKTDSSNDIVPKEACRAAVDQSETEGAVRMELATSLGRCKGIYPAMTSQVHSKVDAKANMGNLSKLR
jgi:hypothetical protein